MHPLQVYQRIQVSFLSNFDKLSEGQVLLDQWGLVVLGPVVMEAAQVHFDQLDHCCLQDLELDFGLQDLKPDLWDLYCIHKLMLSIRISWFRGIRSIHHFSNLLPNQIYLKVFLTLILCYFCIYLKIHPSSLLVRFIR